MIGAGKYDDLCSYVRNKAKAKGVILIIVEGEKGEGFSCQTDMATLLRIPGMLRHMATILEEDKGALSH